MIRHSAKINPVTFFMMQPSWWCLASGEKLLVRAVGVTMPCRDWHVIRQRSTCTGEALGKRRKTNWGTLTPQKAGKGLIMFHDSCRNSPFYLVEEPCGVAIYIYMDGLNLFPLRREWGKCVCVRVLFQSHSTQWMIQHTGDSDHVHSPPARGSSKSNREAASGCWNSIAHGRSIYPIPSLHHSPRLNDLGLSETRLEPSHGWKDITSPKRTCIFLGLNPHSSDRSKWYAW